MSTFSTKNMKFHQFLRRSPVLGLFSCCKAPLGVQLASLPQRFFSTRPMPTAPMGVRTPGAPLMQSPQFLEDILFIFIHRQVGRMMKNPCSCCCVDEVSSISPSSTVKPLCEQSLSAVCHKRLQQWQAGVGKKVARRQDMGASFQLPYAPTWLVS